jgi:hypothetical protein
MRMADFTDRTCHALASNPHPGPPECGSLRNEQGCQRLSHNLKRHEATGGPFAVINHGKSACAWKADGENQHWNITLAALSAADLELLFDLQGLSACQRRDLPYL